MFLGGTGLYVGVLCSVPGMRILPGVTLPVRETLRETLRDGTSGGTGGGSGDDGDLWPTFQ